MADEDLALLDRWCAGDASAGNALFHRHFRSVYRFFEHKIESDAEELVQETFLACTRSRDSFRRANSFKAFLFGIARHTLHHYWRRRRVRGVVVDFDEVSIASLSTSAGTRVARREDRVRLLDALRELPVEQQLILELHYWEDLEREELAAVFEVEPATTRSRLFRAREALRERLADTADSSTVPRNDDLDAWARALRPPRDNVRNESIEWGHHGTMMTFLSTDRRILFGAALALTALAMLWPTTADASGCSAQGCGTNSPVLHGTPIVGLHTGGLTNYEGVVLCTNRLRPATAACDGANNLGVVNGELAGFAGTDRNARNAMKCSGRDLLGATFQIGVPKSPMDHPFTDHPDASCVDGGPSGLVIGTIKIVDLGEVVPWQMVPEGSPPPRSVPTYRLIWVGGDGTNSYPVGRFGANQPSPSDRANQSLCASVPPMEKWQIDELRRVGSVQPIGAAVATDHAMFVQGESYNADATIYQHNNQWFNIACMRSAIAKMRLLGLDPMKDSPGLRDERVATLKMLTARYVDENTYTLQGMPLHYTRPGVSYYGTPVNHDAIEAYWGAGGALCLSHRRTWRKDALACERMTTTCPPTVPASGDAARRIVTGDRVVASEATAHKPPETAERVAASTLEAASIRTILAQHTLPACKDGTPEPTTFWTTYTIAHVPD